MCNCGHEDGGRNEADHLRRRAVVTAAGAGALAGIPALLATSGQSHHALMLTIIAVQIAFLCRALYFVRQRRQILSGCR